MSVTATAVKRQRLRAPQQHGDVLIEPPPSDVGELIEENRRQAAEAAGQLLGRPLSEVSRQARQQLVESASSYTAQYRDVAPHDYRKNPCPLLLSGHQPQLFHPGVWVKNFVVSRLAADHGGLAIHLLIDNDVARQTAVRVPSGSLDEPVAESIEFDAAGSLLPFERRTIHDIERFRSFGRRAGKAIKPLVPDSMVEEFWQRAVAVSRQTDNLGECLSWPRHQLEGEWGLETLELPLSRVCSGQPFCQFAAHLLLDMRHLHEVYNESLWNYRRQHRIRSRSHPVPELDRSGDGWEAPFWVSTDQQPGRHPLWVEPGEHRVRLTDGHRTICELSRREETAVAQLMELAERGVQLRSRALTTTMFVRLVLCDLFVHGIGGAKYDELTDAIISRLFDLPAPHYLVASGTFRLDLPQHNVTDDDLRRVDLCLRELTFHPEKHLDIAQLPPHERERAAAAIERKRAWILADPAPEHRAERHREIVAANEALQPLLAQKKKQLDEERRRLAQRRRDDLILGSREYAFCLFPADELRPWLCSAGAVQ